MNKHQFSCFCAAIFLLQLQTGAAAPPSAAPAASSASTSTAPKPVEDPYGEPAASEIPTVELSETTPPAPAPESSVADRIVAGRKRALRDYETGAVDEAFDGLRRVITECEEAGAQTCGQGARATLYRDIGIVLAQGKLKHDSAVQAFKKALSLKASIVIPSEYSTNKVKSAFSEAKGVAPRSSSESSGHDEAKETRPDSRNEGKRGFLVAEFNGRIGAIGSNGGNSFGMTGLGGALTLGIRPGQGAFALAGRVLGGGYAVSGGGTGYLGAAALLGGVFRGEKPNRFGYVLVGPGIQSLLSGGTAVVMGHVLGGYNAGGFNFGGGLEVGSVANNGWMALFGVHVGIGELF